MKRKDKLELSVCDVEFEILSNILKNEKEMLFDGDMP